MWGHVVAPLYCLLWFPQGTFYTIRQPTTCGSSSWSETKHPEGPEPWAVRCRGGHLSCPHTGDSKTRTQGQPAGVAVGGGGLGTNRTRTDGFYLQEGARVYVTWSQRQADGQSAPGGKGRAHGAGRRRLRAVLGEQESRGRPFSPSSGGSSRGRLSCAAAAVRAPCPPATPGASGEARKETGFFRSKAGGYLAPGGSGCRPDKFPETTRSPGSSGLMPS